jgi:hypothetical protein
MKKLIWILLAAFILSATSGYAAKVPPHGGQLTMQTLNQPSGKKSHGNKGGKKAGKKTHGKKNGKKAKGAKKQKQHKQKQ